MGLQKITEQTICKGKRVQNRIVVPPMFTFAMGREDGMPTRDRIEHYARLAAAGIVITEATGIHPHGLLAPNEMGLWDDAMIPGHRRLAQAIQNGGALALTQLHHAGVYSVGAWESIGPSDYSGERNGKAVNGRAMTIGEIERTRDEFIAAAVRAQSAGYDGIELHAAHGYLLSQFHSPLINVRTDLYGGPVANRARLTLEIIRGIRAACKEDFILGLRLGVNEATFSASLQTAVMAQNAGVDILHLSHGFGGSSSVEPAPQGFVYSNLVYQGSRFKRELQVPTIVVGGVLAHEQAEGILSDGLADYIAAARAHLADPDWTRRIAQNDHRVLCKSCRPKCCWHSVPAKCPGRAQYNRLADGKQ